MKELKEPFVKTVEEIDAEIEQLKRQYATAEARNRRRPRIRSNPPPAFVMRRCQNKIDELNALKEEMTK